MDTVGVGGGHSVFPTRSKALQLARCETPRDRRLAIHGQTPAYFFGGGEKESAQILRIRADTLLTIGYDARPVPIGRDRDV